MLISLSRLVINRIVLSIDAFRTFYLAPLIIGIIFQFMFIKVIFIVFLFLNIYTLPPLHTFTYVVLYSFRRFCQCHYMYEHFCTYPVLRLLFLLSFSERYDWTLLLF